MVGEGMRRPFWWWEDLLEDREIGTNVMHSGTSTRGAETLCGEWWKVTREVDRDKVRRC